jgi:hypothetical protein
LFLLFIRLSKSGASAQCGERRKNLMISGQIAPRVAPRGFSPLGKAFPAQPRSLKRGGDGKPHLLGRRGIEQILTEQP